MIRKTLGVLVLVVASLSIVKAQSVPDELAVVPIETVTTEAGGNKITWSWPTNPAHLETFSGVTVYHNGTPLVINGNQVDIPYSRFDSTPEFVHPQYFAISEYSLVAYTTLQHRHVGAESVAVTAPGVGLSPVASNDSAIVAPLDTVIVSVLANDSDADGTLEVDTVVVVQQPTAGNVVVNVDGTISYTHTDANVLSDGFAYTVEDNDGLLSNTGFVTITATSALPVAGLVGHFVASAGVTGDPTVTAWADQSGQGNDITLSGDPQFSALQLNSQPIIQFDGIDDYGTGTTTGYPINSDDRTMFVVVRYNGGAFAGFGYGALQTDQTFGLNQSGGGACMISTWNGETNKYSPSTCTGAGWLIHAVRLESDVYTQYVDGVATDTGALTVATPASSSFFAGSTLGNPTVPTSFADVDVAEILVYDNALSDADMLIAHQYLNTKYFETGPPPTELLLTSTQVLSLAHNSAQIEAVFPDFVSFQIEWGTTASYGNFTVEDTSFAYKRHVQTLSPLTPETTYHYRLLASDQYGNSYTSNDLTFTTPVAPPPPEPTVDPNWAAAALDDDYDESITYSGLFVGVANGGLYGAGNAVMGAEHSLRVRFPKTGTISKLAYENRYIEIDDIDYRITIGQPYEQCRDYPGGVLYNHQYSAGDLSSFGGNANAQVKLAANRCGFVVGNNYASGTGGEQVMEIWPDDPATGLPDKTAGTPLGTTDPDNGFIPINFADGPYFDLDLTSPASVVAGNVYHIVLRNKRLPPGGKCNGYTTAQAAALPIDVGCISLNGLVMTSGTDYSKLRGPFMAGHETLYKQTPSHAWATSGAVTGHVMGWWTAEYSDGTRIGEYYAGWDSLGGGTTTVGGATQVRNKFVAETSTTVDGVWVNHGQLTTSNGTPLTATLKNNVGTVLATATIASDTVLKNAWASGIFNERKKAWNYADFNVAAPLVGGQTYSIELSSADGAGFTMTALGYVHCCNPEITQYVHDDTDGEVSVNSGATWGNGSGWTSFNDRHYSILMTVEGMPKELIYPPE